MMNNTQEIEYAVLGLMYQYPRLNDKILEVSENDFVFQNSKSLYSACRKVYEEFGNLDQATTLYKLDVNNRETLLKCAEYAITPSLIDNYIEIIKNTAKKKRLTSKVESLAFSNEVSIDELQNIIDEELKNGSTPKIRLKATENIENYVLDLDREKELIPTGFAGIDNYISGIEKGTLFIIGARPSTGKTTFALNVMLNQYLRAYKTVIFSLEMSARMIFDRLVANYLTLNYSDVSQKKLTDENKKQIASWLNEVKETERFNVIDDTYTIENICNQIYELKPDVAVVDFMQIVDSAKPFRDLREKINYISAELKRVAKKTGCVIIALSQVTRQGKDAPTMSDLRESGALEQDGDYIVMLHRPYIADKTYADKSETQVLFDKNKFGWTGRIAFNFDGEHQRFTRPAELSLTPPPDFNDDLPFD